MTIPVRMGKIPLIKASAEAIVPYRALFTPGTLARMVDFKGEREESAKLEPTIAARTDAGQHSTLDQVRGIPSWTHG